ncbi:cytochrome [Sesamum alatum]|uniref:Cytochrome n=1 Tax=Sesamum alatum TaxID=300844 RepID=A0AAE1XM29_9LAMI|nr:cytochrome [Sesamum alatum]
MYSLFTVLFLLLVSLAAWLWILRRAVKPNPGRRKLPDLPPGPNPLPIIGNILELGQKPHQSLAELSKVYGPLMRLKLGTMTTVVVSSPEMARIVLQKSDQVLSSRTHPDAIRALDHHKFSVAWMPVDNQWRKLRKLCKEKMFSTQRLDANQGLRREKLRPLKEYVKECCADGQAVDVGRAAFTTSLNLLSATLFSVDFAAFGSDSSQEFRDVAWGIMAVVGRPNFSDYFPLFQLFDLQAIFRESTFYFKKCFAIFDEIIRQRLQGSDSMSKNDMLEALLAINQKNESELSFDDIKHLLLSIYPSDVGARDILTWPWRDEVDEHGARKVLMWTICGTRVSHHTYSGFQNTDEARC